MFIRKRNCATRVFSKNWGVLTVRKHIVPQEALAGAGVSVGVEEAIDDRVVVPGLQVIEAGLCVVVVAIGAKMWSFGVLKKQPQGS